MTACGCGLWLWLRSLSQYMYPSPEAVEFVQAYMCACLLQCVYIALCQGKGRLFILPVNYSFLGNASAHLPSCFSIGSSSLRSFWNAMRACRYVTCIFASFLHATERGQAHPGPAGNGPLHGIRQESRPEREVLEYEGSRTRAVHVRGWTWPSDQRSVLFPISN